MTQRERKLAMQNNESDLKDGGDLINKWWHLIRPYWHVATFLIIISWVWQLILAHFGSLLWPTL
jgi:hypothetical protein